MNTHRSSARKRVRRGACGAAGLVPRVEDAEVEGFVRVLQRVLARERRRQRLSQEEVAYRAGISRAALSHVESGARDPGFSVFIRITEALGWFTPLLARARALWLRYRFRRRGSRR